MEHPMLGLKTIPGRFAPLLTDKELHQAFSDARALVSRTPSPWEVVEVDQAGGGFQTLDVPFKTVPKDLSDEEVRFGRQRIDEAYKSILAALKQLDKRIAQLERSSLRKLLVVVGLGLVAGGVAILGAGFFRHSEITLIGKDGAATLLLTTGLSLLGSIWAKDRNMRTLTSRIRARLSACLAHTEYSEVRACFMKTLDECNNVFTTIQRRVESKPGAAADISL